ncbi:hypothetical protein Esti_000361 [Eimeria stiedai]
MRGCSPALATEKIEGLLRRTASGDRRGVTSPIALKASRPLIVAFCRPFERSLLRKLLGCTTSGAFEAESDGGGDQVDAHGSAEADKAPVGWQEEEMRNVWSSIGMGLDVLPSGAYLFTVESPGIRGSCNEEGKEADEEARTIANPWEKQQPRDSLGGVSPDDESSDSQRNGAGATKASLGLPCATEAALLASLAAPVVEAADMLLLPLVYQGVAGVAYRPSAQQERPFGELLYLQEAAEDAAERTRGNSSSVGEAGKLVGEAGQGPVLRLPEGVLMLLRSMKHLTQQHARQRAASAGGLQESRKESGASPAARPTRFPHIVLLFGEPLSPGCEAEVKAQVLQELGNAEGKSGLAVRFVQKSEEEPVSSYFRLISMFDRYKLRCRFSLAGSLAKLFTGPPAFRNPSALEYPSCAVASGVCAAAARRALVFARERFSELQKRHLKAPLREPLGARVQRILCEALSSFDLQTRRFQLALDRRVLRKQLQLSLEREARSLYVREALQLEAEAKARLRAALIKALQKDAARFGATAPAILTETVITLSKQLESLLPCSAANNPIKSQEEGLQVNKKGSEIQEHAGGLKSLAASCAAARDAWLSHLVSNSLTELHDFLLQRFARNFSLLALELSRSPLAALLRQQHRRPWLGVSVRPSLAMTTLLRLRGEGNLQGYSRYNTGAVNFLFGFTNDGEGLKPGQHAAVRLQPKLHLDLEVT